MFGKGNKNGNDDDKQKQAKRFYALLQLLMNELFEYASKNGHVKMPYNVSFGLIYDKRDSILLSGADENTGKKVYLYNLRLIADAFEQRRRQMKEDNNPQYFFAWIHEICTIYIRPFVHEYVVNIQHRGKGAADRTTRQIVKGFLNKLLTEPDLKYVLDTIREDKKESNDVEALEH
jgi:hypothetical protein